MAFCWRWLNHVIHLAEEVDEEDGLVVQILQPMHLLLVKVVHFVRRNHAILIQVDHFVPVLQRSQSRLVFLREHEPNEVLIPHLPLLPRLELARHLVEYSVDGLAGEGVPLVTRKVLLVDQKVVICVQLPESTVKHVEVFITKVGSDLIDVFFVAHDHENIEEVRLLEVAICNVTVIVSVKRVENAHYNCVSVALLELRGLLEEFKSWMLLEQVFKHWLEVISYNCVRAILRYNLE